MAADEQVMNRKLGYFDNTRTVLLLPALFGDGDYAASYVNREMNTIFRYPYYRKLDTEGYTGKAYSPSELPALAEQTGADIVVMPVISRWQQIIMHPMLFRMEMHSLRQQPGSISTPIRKQTALSGMIRLPTGSQKMKALSEMFISSMK